MSRRRLCKRPLAIAAPQTPALLSSAACCMLRTHPRAGLWEYADARAAAASGWTAAWLACLSIQARRVGTAPRDLNPFRATSPYKVPTTNNQQT